MGPEVPLEHCSRSRLWSALSFGHRYSQFIWLIKICCMLMDLSQSVRWRGGGRKRVGNSHSWCHFPLWADSPLPPSTTSCTYLSKLTSRKCCTFLAMDHGAGIPTMCRLDKGHLSPVIKASQQQKPTEARELLRPKTQFLLQLQLHLQLRSPVDNIKEVLKLVVDRGLIL